MATYDHGRMEGTTDIRGVPAELRPGAKRIVTKQDSIATLMKRIDALERRVKWLEDQQKGRK